jgi:hypothetical protein
VDEPVSVLPPDPDDLVDELFSGIDVGDDDNLADA